MKSYTIPLRSVSLLAVISLSLLILQKKFNIDTEPYSALVYSVYGLSALFAISCVLFGCVEKKGLHHICNDGKFAMFAGAAPLALTVMLISGCLPTGAIQQFNSMTPAQKATVLYAESAETVKKVHSEYTRLYSLASPELKGTMEKNIAPTINKAREVVVSVGKSIQGWQASGVPESDLYKDQLEAVRLLQNIITDLAGVSVEVANVKSSRYNTSVGDSVQPNINSGGTP